VLFLIYGLLGDKLPSVSVRLLAPSFAIAVGIAFMSVGTCLYFVKNADWLYHDSRRTANRRAERIGVNRILHRYPVPGPASSPYITDFR